ncbi:glycogen synthase GlgA [Arachidicoccus ginsenosidivorans]|jgi:starch synthase|uniref:Glycogen synthase n=1 Tax=Arachidicoccus ginsenosidivorans TaxID=496057 RepID=A0A5B8VG73_9BACT|nr:glycogen synthase [Arachidicoccus ginsenosidivorans]QEC70494.1 glycogen synthase [Arachidicoccus ginsenosidivorans]
MKILHVTAECYPVAKVGGLGDVAGALPKYQKKLGHTAMLVMPMYKTPFLNTHQWAVVHKGQASLGDYHFNFTIIREEGQSLGFDLYLVDINGLLDRPKVYGYPDDPQRFIAFQTAVATWLQSWKSLPDIVHLHDYHTGLLPFYFKHGYGFRRLENVPTVLTVHNAEYQGWLDWRNSSWLPAFDEWKSGLLEWNKTINPLASAIKNAWAVTTVSPSYLQELRFHSNGLEALFEYEKGKCSGILNGIDSELWNPQTDGLLEHHYHAKTVTAGKRANKKAVSENFGLNPDKPLFTFIGRLVGEKAADLLPDSLAAFLREQNGAANVIVLGSGEPEIEAGLQGLKGYFPANYDFYKGYSEQLSHALYAGADFLLMPSRVEPCGLNQMYALRYGTVPLVRRTGGLRDTITDIGDNGNGLCFDQASIGDILMTMNRAMDLYAQPKKMEALRFKMMQIDHSWEKTVSQYIDLYQSLIDQNKQSR